MRLGMRFGLVGLGVISRFYLAAAERLPSVRLTAVCDLDETTLKPHRDGLACFSDHRSMLAGADLDAVVVTVPNDAHGEVCRDVLAAGLPVCVEKPLAIDLQEGERLASLARRRGVALFTAFHRRYNDNVRALARRLAGLPPVISLTVRYLERIEDHVGRDGWYLDPRRCGGGCVADNGPNAVDLARFFLGPLRLTGAEITRDGRGVDRRALLSLCAAAGTPVRIELDWSHTGETKDVTVTLADGSVHRADLLAGHAEFKGSLWHEYVGVLRDFARTVARGQSPDHGLAALTLTDAAYRTEGEPCERTDRNVRSPGHW